jgi:hypothetical protein
MKWPDILPPTDLLERVEGIEEGLRQGKRLGIIGWVGVLASVLQVTVQLQNSDWWAALSDFDWNQLALQWPLFVSLFILVISLILVSWNRFLLKESREPFRYTYFIEDFTSVTATPQKECWSWLRHDLSEQFRKRIGRLFLLDEQLAKADDKEQQAERDRDSYIHISGSYLLREKDGHPMVEVLPRIRIGPPGRPETLAHPVVFDLHDMAGLIDAKQDNSAPEKSSQDTLLLKREEYDQVLERVYFSIASQIYKQIRQDVQRKIDLLPTNYYRATAYFHEAEDYARSNTIDGYDEARKLYEAVIELYDPWRRPLPKSWWLRLLQYTLRGGGSLLRLVEGWLSYLFPRFGRFAVMVARAEIGYSNMLLYRRILAAVSGHRVNSIFETQSISQRAVERLKRLEDVPGQRECLFDAYVTQALAWASLVSFENATNSLEEARRLLPFRAEQDARFFFVSGNVEPRLSAALMLYRRAIELDPDFEVAQFSLAVTAESLWRSRATLEPNVAELIFTEFKRVLSLNPGNIGAWANLGYMYWLLGDLQKAQNAYDRGREYKEIKHETFVAELDYGLARIAAERGDFQTAYKYASSAVAAYVAQGTDHSGQSRTYYFDRISIEIRNRFEKYKHTVEAQWKVLTLPPNPQDLAVDQSKHDQKALALPLRVRDFVYAFVLNDYGEACSNYFNRSFDQRYRKKALSAYTEAIDLIQAHDDNNVMPYYNLHQLDNSKPSIERVRELEPEWSEGKLAKIKSCVEQAKQAIEAANTNRPKANEKQDNAPKQRNTKWIFDFRRFRVAAQAKAEADNSEKAAVEQERQIHELLNEAEELIRSILPHKWLWVRSKRGRSKESVSSSQGVPEFNWQMVNRKDLKRQHRWQKEFNEIQVRAMLAWVDVLVCQAECTGQQIPKAKVLSMAQRLVYSMRRKRKAPSKAQKLLHHIQESFWTDDFDILLKGRAIFEDEKAIEHYNEGLRASIKAWSLGDPTSHQTLSWYTDDAFKSNIEDKKKKFAEAIEKEYLPGSLYRWLGDQLLDLEARDVAMRAYSRAMQTDDPELLFDLANVWEKLERWDDSLRAYQQAMQYDAEQAEPSRPLYIYHRRMGRALLALDKAEEALSELEASGTTDQARSKPWMAAAVRDLLGQINSSHCYQIIKTWLERQHQHYAFGTVDDLMLRDAHQATLLLVREKFPSLGRGTNRRPVDVNTTQMLPVMTPITLNADRGLFPQAGDTPQAQRMLLEEDGDISKMRRRFQENMGVTIPGVRVRGGETLGTGNYMLALHEVPIVSGTVDVKEQYCPDAANCQALGISGRVSTALGNGREGMWLAEPAWKKAQAAELELWDAYDYMLHHLETLIHRHLATFLGVQETEAMLEKWVDGQAARRAQINGALPDAKARVRLVQVLQGLVNEAVPVKNLEAILGAFAHANPQHREVHEVIEEVRKALRSDLQGTIANRQLIVLASDFEARLAQWLQRRDGKQFLSMPQQQVDLLLESIRERMAGRDPHSLGLVVKKAHLRPFTRRLVEVSFPSLSVFSEQELVFEDLAWRGTKIEYADELLPMYD